MIQNSGGNLKSEQREDKKRLNKNSDAEHDAGVTGLAEDVKSGKRKEGGGRYRYNKHL